MSISKNLLFDRLCQIIIAKHCINSKITEHSVIQDELGLDSIDVLEFVFDIEKEFDVNFKKIDGIYFFGDVVKELYNALEAGNIEIQLTN